MAAQLVLDLRLDALPLEEYAYGALLTALSRVRGAALVPPFWVQCSCAAPFLVSDCLAS